MHDDQTSMAGDLKQQRNEQFARPFKLPYATRVDSGNNLQMLAIQVNNGEQRIAATKEAGTGSQLPSLQ